MVQLKDPVFTILLSRTTNLLCICVEGEFSNLTRLFQETDQTVLAILAWEEYRVADFGTTHEKVGNHDLGGSVNAKKWLDYMGRVILYGKGSGFSNNIKNITDVIKSNNGRGGFS